MAAPEDDTAEQVRKLFAERSLAFCGEQVVGIKQCLTSPSAAKGCDSDKQALLECMKNSVCGLLHERLQSCLTSGGKQEDCAEAQQNLNRCLGMGYASLPPREESVASVKKRLAALKNK